MSQLISLQDAIDMTSLYRQRKEDILQTNYRNQAILAQCETFDKGDIDTLLGQTDCIALRIYYGMDSSYKVHSIIVGVDRNDNDILPSGVEKILEVGVRCPVDCPQPSSLNR